MKSVIEKPFSYAHRRIVMDTIEEMEWMIRHVCSMEKMKKKGVLSNVQRLVFQDGVSGVLQKGAERLERLYKKGLKDPDKYDWEARSIMWRGMLALAWSSWVSEAKSRDGARPAKSRSGWAEHHHQLRKWATQYLAIGESQVWPIMHERKNKILDRSPDMSDYVMMCDGHQYPKVCDWCGEDCGNVHGKNWHLDSSGNVFHRYHTVWFLCDKCLKKRSKGKYPPEE